MCVSKLRAIVYFAGGFTLGQLYYFYFIKDIKLPYNAGLVLAIIISIILGKKSSTVYLIPEIISANFLHKKIGAKF